jgi:hypothetical protein
MRMTMSRAKETNEAVVERARRLVAARGKLRWVMLMYAVLFLGFSGYVTIAGIRKIEDLDGQQLSRGFVYGLGLAVVWTSFGLVGALCLAKFLVGFSGDFRAQELLVSYHGRERDDPANGNQPIRSETSGTSPRAGSHR